MRRGTNIGQGEGATKLIFFRTFFTTFNTVILLGGRATGHILVVIRGIRDGGIKGKKVIRMQQTLFLSECWISHKLALIH